MNCDMSNIKRTLSATEKLRKAVDILMERDQFEALDEETKATVKLRLDGEAMSLESIAEKLGVTKSCVNHRLRKVISLAFDD